MWWFFWLVFRFLFVLGGCFGWGWLLCVVWGGFDRCLRYWTGGGCLVVIEMCGATALKVRVEWCFSGEYFFRKSGFW